MGTTIRIIRSVIIQVIFLFTIGQPISGVLAQATRGDIARTETNNIEVLLARGDSAFTHFNNVLAARYYENAIDLDSTDFRALLKLSRAYTTESMDLVDNNDKTEARVIVEASVQLADRIMILYPDRAETYFQLAVAYGISAIFAGGKRKLDIGRKVEKYCLKSIEIDPGYAPPYMLLGIFYRKIAELGWVEKLMAKTLLGGLPKGGRKKAGRYLEQAMERNPEMILGWFELGVTRLSLKENEAALLALEKAIALKPASSNDLRTLEKTRQKLTKYFDR